MSWWLWLAIAAAGLLAWRLTRPREREAPDRGAQPARNTLRQWETVVTVETSSPQDEEDDEHYAQFVAATWAAKSVACGPTPMEVNGRSCIVHTLTPAEGKPPYVNLVFAGSSRRYSYAGDSRHRWTIGGQRVSASVFKAIAEGSASPADIKPDDHPATLDDALALDRLTTTRRRFALQYASADGIVSWRVISRLQRGPDHLYAACHLRWGETRSFRYDRILTLLDIESGHTVDMVAYIARRVELPARRKQRRD